MNSNLNYEERKHMMTNTEMSYGHIQYDVSVDIYVKTAANTLVYTAISAYEIQYQALYAGVLI